MTTKWLMNSVLLLVITAAGATLILGDAHSPFLEEVEFGQAGGEQTVIDQSESPEQAQQVILRKIQRLEALGQLGQLADPVTIPFNYVGGHILISAQIQGLDTTKTLIVDSGIRSTLLDRELVSGLTLSAPFRVDHNVFYGLLNQISLAGADFYNVGTFSAEFSAPGQPLSCLSDSGVIGANMMHHAIWQIDYQRQTLTVTDSIEDLDDVTDAITIPFDLIDLIPVITLNIGTDQTVPVLVDTGWGGSIHLAAQDLIGLDVEQFQVTSTTEGLVETLRGLESFRQKTIQVPVLSIGDLTLANFPVLVSDGENAQPYSLLGNEFLEHFVVTLDWSTHQLHLKPVSPISSLYSKPPDYGFQSLVYDHNLLITGLYYPSPATKVGLQVGDQILVINDDTYTYLGDEQFCAFVRSPVGDRYTGAITMTVARQGSLLTYTVVPEGQF